jgi:ABC-type amino acid transport substrate-binding protein
MLCSLRDGDEDLEHMMHLLEEDKYDALVLDTPVLQYKEGTDHHCVLFVMGESFEMFSLAVVFPKDSNQTLVDSISVSMVRQQVCKGH